jgi:hypothetical protein
MKIKLYFFKFIQLTPLLGAVTITLAAAYRPLSLNRDLLEDYSLITQDGFQWIIQGRALANLLVSETWPELRNPGYVVITALDAIFGSFGLIISISTAIALLIQLWVIHKIAREVSLSQLSSGAIALAFILNPINFIALHLLSDAISVSIMMLMVFVTFLIIHQEKQINPISLFLLGSIGALFQLYTLYPILLLLFFIIILFQQKQINLKREYLKKLFIITSAGLILGLFLRYFWYSLIEHQSTPKQFELIVFSLKNLMFYVNTWSWLLAPIFLSGLYFVIIKKVKIVKKEVFKWYLITLSTIYATSIFFYDWQESRFSYFLVALLFVLFIVIISKEKREVTTNFISVNLVVLALIFGSIFTPTNKWAPEIGESVMWRPWILHGFWGSPPYLEYVNARNQFCKNGVIQIEVDEQVIRENIPIVANSDPNLGIFALKNCL